MRGGRICAYPGTVDTAVIDVIVFISPLLLLLLMLMLLPLKKIRGRRCRY